MDGVPLVCCDAAADFRQPPQELLDLLEQVGKNATPIFFKSGQTLFYEGHKPYGLFIIQEGRVIFEKSGKAHDESLETKILGLQHLISNTPYCASCKAATPVKAIFVPKGILKKFACA